MARLTDLFPPLYDVFGGLEQWTEPGFETTSSFFDPQSGYPALNICEQGDRVFLEAELPGVTAANVDVTVAGAEVVLSGHRKPLQQAQATWARQERPHGRYSRSITLPWEIDAKNVEASLHDGILTITLTKAEKCRTKKIAVKTA